MKKRLVMLITIFALIFMANACGKAENVVLDLQGIYEKILASPETPDMVQIPAEKAELLFGIPVVACTQEIIAICQDSLRADEFWLIEAKDEAEAEEVEALAKARAEQKASELKDYLPEQYQVAKKAQILRQGRYLALIVSPSAGEFAKLFQ